MEAIIYPRHEVFQLVLAPLSGRGIHTHSLVEIAKCLHGEQTISFDRWSQLAQELLRFSDGAVQLFWDMLVLAVEYTTRTPAWALDLEPPPISTRHLLLFLSLHVSSRFTQGAPLNSSHTSYDAIWPVNGDEAPQAPTSNLEPANTQLHSNAHTFNARALVGPRLTPGSPKSPRSPKSQQPVRSLRHANSAHSHVSFLRSRMPLLLRLVSSDPACFLQTPTHSQRYDVITEDFVLTYDDLRALNLVICAAVCTSNSEVGLEDAYSNWTSPYSIDNLKVASASEALAQLTGSLSLNENVYPDVIPAIPSPSPSRSPSVSPAPSPSSSPRHNHSTNVNTSSNVSLNPNALGLSFEESVHPHLPGSDVQRQPTLIVELLHELSRDKPVCVAGVSKTYIHRVKKLDGPELGPGGPSLPNILAHGCFRSYLFFVGCYNHAHVNGCSDSEVIIGAVRGAAVVSGCERCKITVACRKIIVRNCLDCTLCVAVTSPPIVVGDCRGLRFSPHDVSYVSLGWHVWVCGLPSPWPLELNKWSEVCDVTQYVERGGTRTESMEIENPFAFEGKSSLVSPAQFFFRSVPIAEESISGQEGPINPVGEYVLAVRQRIDAWSQLRSRMVERGLKESDVAAVQARLTAHFNEWLVATSRSQSILDLMRLDMSQRDTSPHTPHTLTLAQTHTSPSDDEQTLLHLHTRMET